MKINELPPIKSMKPLEPDNHWLNDHPESLARFPPRIQAKILEFVNRKWYLVIHHTRNVDIYHQFIGCFDNLAKANNYLELNPASQPEFNCKLYKVIKLGSLDKLGEYLYLRCRRISSMGANSLVYRDTFLNFANAFNSLEKKLGRFSYHVLVRIKPNVEYRDSNEMSCNGWYPKEFIYPLE